MSLTTQHELTDQETLATCGALTREITRLKRKNAKAVNEDTLLLIATQDALAAMYKTVPDRLREILGLVGVDHG